MPTDKRPSDPVELTDEQLDIIEFLDHLLREVDKLWEDEFPTKDKVLH